MYTHSYTHSCTYTVKWFDPDLLSLLDGAHGVWLELQFLRAAQFPVEDDDDDENHHPGDHHPNDQPHITGLCLRGGQG